MKCAFVGISILFEQRGQSDKHLHSNLGIDYSVIEKNDSVHSRPEETKSK
jgi:hypothetical protein